MTQEPTILFGIAAVKNGPTSFGGLSALANRVAKGPAWVEQSRSHLHARFKVQYEFVARQVSERSDLWRKNMNEVAR